MHCSTSNIQPLVPASIEDFLFLFFVFKLLFLLHILLVIFCDVLPCLMYVCMYVFTLPQTHRFLFYFLGSNLILMFTLFQMFPFELALCLCDMSLSFFGYFLLFWCSVIFQAYPLLSLPHSWNLSFFPRSPHSF